MGFWRWTGEVVGYAAAPFTYGASLVLAKSARDSVGDLANQITGREVSGDMSKKQNYENSLYSGEFDKTSERLDKLEKATGISQQDSIEKIKEIKENNHSTIKDLLEQLKRDPARRKEIYDEIVSQTKADLKAMNDILQEDTRKLEKKQLKSLEELQEAKDDDDKKQISILNAETKKQEIALRQLRDINKDLDKKMKEQKSERETVNKLVESQNKTWFQDLNFASWYLWLALLILTFLGWFIYQNFMKIKSKLFSNNQT